MQRETKDRWQKLCEQAATEQDAQALMKLIEEINHLFEEKKKRLLRVRADAQIAA
jgi:hypothetical protein